MALVPCLTDFGNSLLNNTKGASAFMEKHVSEEIHYFAEITSFINFFSDYFSK